jgi:hypothetical protein
MNKMTHDVPSVTLYPSRLSAVGLLLMTAALTAAGIWMGLSGRWIGSLIGGFFALGIPIAVLQLIRGSTYLHVDQTGFTFSTSFRKSTILWSVVGLRQHRQQSK